MDSTSQNLFFQELYFYFRNYLKEEHQLSNIFFSKLSTVCQMFDMTNQIMKIDFCSKIQV